MPSSASSRCCNANHTRLVVIPTPTCTRTQAPFVLLPHAHTLALLVLIAHKRARAHLTALIAGTTGSSTTGSQRLFVVSCLARSSASFAKETRGALTQSPRPILLADIVALGLISGKELHIYREEYTWCVGPFHFNSLVILFGIFLLVLWKYIRTFTFSLFSSLPLSVSPPMDICNTA